MMMMMMVMVIMMTTTTMMMVLISGRGNVKNRMRDFTRVKFTRENWTSCKRRNTWGANTWSSEVLGSWERPREAAGCDTWGWRPSSIALLPGGTGRSFLCWWARSTRPWYSGLGLPSPGGESVDRAAGKSRLGGMYIDEYIWRISTKDKHVHTYKTSRLKGIYKITMRLRAFWLARLPCWMHLWQYIKRWRVYHFRGVWFPRELFHKRNITWDSVI